MLQQILLYLKVRAWLNLEPLPVFFEEEFEEVADVHELYSIMKHKIPYAHGAKMIVDWIQNVRNV